MKKAILALLMAIVMVFTAMTVYAYGASEEGINGKINPCPHVMIHDIIVGTTQDSPQTCHEHPNCMYTVYYDVYRTVCMECGAPLSDTWPVYSHTIHNQMY